MRTGSVVRPDVPMGSEAGGHSGTRLWQSPSIPWIHRNKRRLRLCLYAMLLIGDLACIFGAFAVGALLKFGNLHELTWLRMSLAAAPLYFGIAMHNGAFTLNVLRSPTTGAARASGALIVAMALLFVVSYFLKAEQHVSRLSVAAAIILSVGSLAVARKLVGEWIQTRFQGQFTAGIIIADESFPNAPPGTILVDAVKEGLIPDASDPLMLQRFARLVQGADTVVIACRREVCLAWATLLKGASIRGEILADEVQELGPIAIGRVGDRTTLVVSSGPLTVQQRALKRALDLAITVPLLILISPVLLLVALAIKLESQGPVLFSQPRVGFGNQLFIMYKFRSMVAAHADLAGAQSTLPNDPRITRVGRFIRSTSLDELPQLFNVLMGSMSVVGPRPHAVGSLAGQELFWTVDDRYSHRHVLKPGITGLAQVRGFRGATHQRHDLTDRLQCDLEYIAGWSIWRDLLIVMKTIHVVVHTNAY